MATKRHRSRARPKKKRIVSRRKPHIILDSAHAMGNPMAISMPPNSLPAHKAKIIIQHGKLQHRLWTWCVVLSLFGLMLVTLFEWVGPKLWGWTLTPSRERVLAQLDMLALGVLILEMGTQFRAAKNKVVFLKQNWLIIIALLPLGVMVRALRVFEGFEALRFLQMLGKFGELKVAVPNLELAFLAPVVVPVFAPMRSFWQWSGLGELFELINRMLARLSR